MKIEKNFKRRSITIPSDLNELIEYKFKNSNYTFINELIIELIELGLIKLDDINENKLQNQEIISKLDEIILMLKN